MLNSRNVNQLMQLPDSMRSLIRLRCLEITAKAEQLRQLIQPGCWSSLQYICFYRSYIMVLSASSTCRLWKAFIPSASISEFSDHVCFPSVVIPQVNDPCFAYVRKLNYANGLEALTRTFVVSGLIVGLDLLLKAICLFGFGVPLFIDNIEHPHQVKWGLWVFHRLVLTAVYGFILFMYHSKWRERLPARPAFYKYFTIMFFLNALVLLGCGLTGNGSGFGFWLYNITTICYHAFYLPLLYITFLADVFQEEDLHLENVYYSEMKDAGFFDADWEISPRFNTIGAEVLSLKSLVLILSISNRLVVPLLRLPCQYYCLSIDVVQFWLANGLLEYPNQNDEWEDVGIRYLNELWSRCFIQDVKDSGCYFTFKLHDLIHDLALDVSQKECKTVGCQTKSIDEKLRHLSFSDDQPLEAAPQFLKKLKGVRTIIGYERFSVIEFCVSNYKYLRTLNLSYSSSWEVLPESVGTLKHLRYLDLRECRGLRKFPSSFCRLVSLQMLNIRNVDKLMQLPESIRSLNRLRCLEITAKAEQLRQLIQPGCWSSLQYLCFYRCDLESIVEVIHCLTSLRTLYLNHCYLQASLPRSLTSLTKLEHLQIDRCHGMDFQMEPAEEEEQDLHLNLKTFSISESEATRKLPRWLLEGSASTLQSHVSWFNQPTPTGCGKPLLHPPQTSGSCFCISFMDCELLLRLLRLQSLVLNAVLDST
ncbi:hypothetical protein COLO4_36045 [Corchorus olitorius]|uniref:Uncharacterized protein n=1 Tax=Corchorus olitorius TaxID=93759 RepID=A0A1R3GB57_9ROSI|nr:hypothetical protein COLO4_36045 [Corchorus olitorius]